jgi:hypothetical protein
MRSDGKTHYDRDVTAEDKWGGSTVSRGRSRSNGRLTVQCENDVTFSLDGVLGCWEAVGVRLTCLRALFASSLGCTRMYGIAASGFRAISWPCASSDCSLVVLMYFLLNSLFSTPPMCRIHLFIAPASAKSSKDRRFGSREAQVARHIQGRYFFHIIWLIHVPFKGYHLIIHVSY